MDDYELDDNAVPLISVVHINVIDPLTDHVPYNRSSVSIAPDPFKKEIHINSLAVSLFQFQPQRLDFPAASLCSCSYHFAILANRASSILPDTLSSHSLSKSIFNPLPRASSASRSRRFHDPWGSAHHSLNKVDFVFVGKSDQPLDLIPKNCFKKSSRI